MGCGSSEFIYHWQKTRNYKKLENRLEIDKKLENKLEIYKKKSKYNSKLTKISKINLKFSSFLSMVDELNEGHECR